MGKEVVACPGVVLAGGEVELTAGGEVVVGAGGDEDPGAGTAKVSPFLSSISRTKLTKQVKGMQNKI